VSQCSVVGPAVPHEAQTINPFQPFYHIDRVPQRAVDGGLFGRARSSPPKRDDRAYSYLGEWVPQRLDPTVGIGFLLPIPHRRMQRGQIVVSKGIRA
jgi:hypothetical protein